VIALLAPVSPMALLGAVVGCARNRSYDREHWDDDTALKAAIEGVAVTWPTEGSRRVTAPVRRQGWTVHYKRGGRLMDARGLRGPLNARARRRSARSSSPAPRTWDRGWPLGVRTRWGGGHHLSPVAPRLRLPSRDHGGGDAHHPRVAAGAGAGSVVDAARLAAGPGPAQSGAPSHRPKRAVGRHRLEPAARERWRPDQDGRGGRSVAERRGGAAYANEEGGRGAMVGGWGLGGGLAPGRPLSQRGLQAQAAPLGAGRPPPG
jgi:hypothetical protein